MKFWIIPLLLGTFTAIVEGAITGSSVTIRQSGYLKLTDCFKSTHNKMSMIVPINTCIHDTTSRLGGKAIRYVDVMTIDGVYDDSATTG